MVGGVAELMVSIRSYDNVFMSCRSHHREVANEVDTQMKYVPAGVIASPKSRLICHHCPVDIDLRAATGTLVRAVLLELS